ncbi:MAG: GTP-binding protein [Candidatus Heimdallarchaeota archaeon]|nr:GTP-binding protein [Candidatus Heimdallarchaeota archaeon]
MGDKKSTDFLWKIALAGDSFVGKTTIRKRAMGEHFAEEYISTVGADFSSYKLKLGDLVIGFQVWDLAGQDKYKYIRSSFYGGATGCFLVYDVTNPRSLKSLSTWVDEAIRYSNGTIEIFIICANKIDLKGKREISRETGMKYTQALRESSGLQCEYIETSALTGENIDVAFDMMAKCLLEREGISPAKLQEPTMPPSQELTVEEKPLELLKTEPERKETTQIIETIPAAKASIVEKKEEAASQTDKLIAEVMAVLDETDEIIIGKEQTKTGERVITISKTDAEKSLPKVEEEPQISSQLETILKQINKKLDGLTNRLKDLEEEISSVKMAEPEKPVREEAPKRADRKELEEVSEKEDEEDELDLLAQLPLPSEGGKKEERAEEKEEFEEQKETIKQETRPESSMDSNLDEEEAALESLLETSPQKESTEEFQTDTLTNNDNSSTEEAQFNQEGRAEENERESITDLEDLPDEELVEIPDAEPLIPLSGDTDEEIIEDRSVLGTELSSALISELKDIKGEEEKKGAATETQLITQPLKVEEMDEKHLCPICGEKMKYIRQYKRFYCVKCGRYLI